MELKHQTFTFDGEDYYLLIVPYGIETMNKELIKIIHFHF